RPSFARCTCASPVYNAPGRSSRRLRSPLRRFARFASRDSSAVLRLWCSGHNPCRALSSWISRPSAWSTSVAVPQHRTPDSDRNSHLYPHRLSTRARMRDQSGGNSCRRFDFHQFDLATAATGPDDLIDLVLGPLQSGADSAQTVHLGAERPSPHGHHLEVGLSELEPLRLLDVGGLQLLQLAEDHFRLCRTHDFSTARRIYGSTKW